MSVITKEELGTLISENRPAMLRLSYRILHNYADAEDAVGETTLKAFEHKDSLQKKDRARSWLMQILVNVSKNIIKKNARLELREDFAPEDATSLRILDLSETVEASEQNRNVRSAVSLLKEDYRSVILLYYFQGMTIREIAGQTGLSPNAVKVRLHRARKELKTMLRYTAVCVLLLLTVFWPGASVPRETAGEAVEPSEAYSEGKGYPFLSKALKASGISMDRTLSSAETAALEEMLANHTVLGIEGGDTVVVRISSFEERLPDAVCYNVSTREFYLPERPLTREELAGIAQILQDLQGEMSPKEPLLPTGDHRPPVIAKDEESTDRTTDPQPHSGQDGEEREHPDSSTQKDISDTEETALTLIPTSATDGGTENKEVTTMGNTIYNTPNLSMDWSINPERESYTLNVSQEELKRRLSESESNPKIQKADLSQERWSQIEEDAYKALGYSGSAEAADVTISEDGKKLSEQLQEYMAEHKDELVTMDIFGGKTSAGLLAQAKDTTVTGSNIAKALRAENATLYHQTETAAEAGNRYAQTFSDISSEFKKTLSGHLNWAGDFVNSDVTAENVDFDTIHSMMDTYDSLRKEITENYEDERQQDFLNALDEAYNSTFEANILNPIKEVFDNKFYYVQPDREMVRNTKISAADPEVAKENLSFLFTRNALNEQKTAQLTEGTKDFYSMASDPSAWHNKDAVDSVIRDSVTNYSQIKQVQGTGDAAYQSAKAAADAIAKEIADRSNQVQQDGLYHIDFSVFSNEEMDGFFQRFRDMLKGQTN